MANTEPFVVTVQLSKESKAYLEGLKQAATEGKVVIERHLLNGWDNGKPLTGADWRAFAESLPAGEFASTLLLVADAIDRTDGTGRFARKEVSA